MSHGRAGITRALRRLGLTGPEARASAATVFGLIETALAAGREVSIAGFGSFRFRSSSRREMWDPRARSRRPVAGRVLLRFQPAAGFLRRLRDPAGAPGADR